MLTAWNEKVVSLCRLPFFFLSALTSVASDIVVDLRIQNQMENIYHLSKYFSKNLKLSLPRKTQELIKCSVLFYKNHSRDFFRYCA